MKENIPDPANLNRLCTVTDNSSTPAKKYLKIIGGTEDLYLVKGFVDDWFTHQGTSAFLAFGNISDKTDARWMHPDEIIFKSSKKPKNQLFSIDDL